jgi:ABC-type Fe3+/spermidine/putrescine transport system ATPase subunit
MIKLEQISKSFDKVEVIKSISFQVNTGEAIALVGPSGGGKTTILRLIAGFEVPDSGNITIDDRLVSWKGYASPPNERGIGMVFQKPALWPHMTLAQNISFGLKGMSKTETKKRLEELFHLTHLDGKEGRYPHQVSGGEAQRATLARAIASKPNILFLDEPMIGFDQDLIVEMTEVLRQLRDETKMTIIYVSHDFSEVKTITDRIILISRGEISYNGHWNGFNTDRPLK